MSTAPSCPNTTTDPSGADGSSPRRSVAGSSSVLGEPERLVAIERLALHGHLGDPHLDALVAELAAACAVPLVMVTIVTPGHQTYPAEVGVGACSTAIADEEAFCAEVVCTRRALVVADALSHPVYGANPFVVDGLIGAYAGEPLLYAGHVIGTLAMVDHAPRTFTTRELALLRAQARLVTAAVRLRATEMGDPLTGLGNRAVLLERAQRALRRRTASQIVALMVVDVIGMRTANATMGTAAGDAVLHAVGHRLQAACGGADSVARIGDEEFAVLFGDVASGADADARAASICDAVKGTVAVRGVPVTPDLRWGLSSSYALTAEELLAAAKRAVAHAPLPSERVERDRAPDDVADLAAGINDNELVLHYHPVVELATGTVTGVEALVRWQHPVRGLLTPQQFIPLAEASGLIVQLGDWVLRAAATQAGVWAAGGRVLDVAINLSPLQMTTPSFADDCLRLLAALRAPIARIVVEVTESALLEQPHAREGLITLRQSGLRLALDDFGTGYCSFSYLRQFPIDVIKIDRSFVGGLGQHPDDDAIVASVVSLARNTGKVVIAEGVETDAQLVHLRNLGVDAAQGFFWTRPLPADRLETWIAEYTQRGRSFPAQQPALSSTSGGRFTAPEDTIMQMHGEGASLHTIAAALNRTGSRTPVGLRWHVRTVARVISSPAPPADTSLDVSAPRGALTQTGARAR